MKKIMLIACAVMFISACDNNAVAAESNKTAIGSLTCCDFKGEVLKYRSPNSGRMTTSYTDTEGVEHETSHPCSFTKYAEK